ncbi:Gfo/Idh/MocA family protein [Edaphobacter albus]|uniref:Gfo/Idh/MocA family protein n=1 Tax=Edaphobacter sp. 4G125 TaxID=2763071 RepID=UPI0016456972|nr:Gfo/Idh/MocA family oxidoreductase [Edaphobacter sp. 4G125]QNI36506.1 Gfo/Idh/MocA family oxidoreductase [Edaphobacter sp. 4G125]
MDRRKFVQGAATASGLLFVKPQTAFSYAANSRVRWGLLGCGRRGTAVATSFAKNAGVEIVALADIFPDQLARGKQHFDKVNASLGLPAIDQRRMFRGHDASKAIAACKDVDAVQISTPPFFHVDHLDTVTAGGKHAYCEKPVGVDVPQTRRALEIGQRENSKVSMAVGFQIRSAPPFVELVRRIHAGQIGKIAQIAAYYNAPPAAMVDGITPGTDEYRLRNWLLYKNLSGDILVEQNIHVIDVCNWVMQSHPIAAYAKSSRKVIQRPGDTADNYEIIYTYPDDIEMSFTSTQFNKNHFFDVSERFFGSEGLADAPYSGALQIRGTQPWAWSSGAAKPTGQFAANGDFSDNLAEADPMKDRDFVQSIVSGKFQNQIAAGVDTARSCIMGRKSAETGRTVTWQEIEADNDAYSLGMDLKQFS